MSDNWKYEQSAKTLDAFFRRFGDLDEHSRVVLEIIFEEIYGKTLRVSGETGQDGNQTSLRSPNRQGSIPDQNCRIQGDESSKRSAGRAIQDDENKPNAL